MSDLFRKEAVTHATRRLNGEVMLATPLSFRLIAALATAVVVGAVLFVATASCARKETVSGWRAPEAGMIKLAARQGGITSTVHNRPRRDHRRPGFPDPSGPGGTAQGRAGIAAGWGEEGCASPSTC